MPFRRTGWGKTLAAWLALALFCAALAAEAPAVSQPSADAWLAFTVSGRVAAAKVREGDEVAAGDVLLTLEDGLLQARLRQLEVEAASDTEIRAAMAERGQKIQDVQRLEQIHGRGAATDLELEYARLEVLIAGFRLELAEQNRKLASLRLEEAQAEWAQYRLRAPFAGRVETLDGDAGESARALEPVVRLVRLDPLWVEAHVPLGMAAKIRPGMALPVRFPDGAVENGAVFHVASVADPASDTLRVRLEVPNPGLPDKPRRIAGERLAIWLPES